MTQCNTQPSTQRGDRDAPSGKLPLTVWPCRQVSAQQQRARRYPRANRDHPGKMLPELARRIVGAFSESGDLVVDPLAGTGTTLVEGAALGRRCVGVELESRWAALAQANLAYVLPGGQRALAEIRGGDARDLPSVLGDLAGGVDLVATSPPYACQTGVIDTPGWRAGRSLCAPGSRVYSPDEADIARASGAGYERAMAAVYAGCLRVLRPGGLLVTVTKNTRRRGRLADLAAATVRLASEAGFVYQQHVIALHAAVRAGGLVAQPSLWQYLQIRRAREGGAPVHLVVHEDVCVFTKPPEPASVREAECG